MILDDSAKVFQIELWHHHEFVAAVEGVVDDDAQSCARVSLAAYITELLVRLP